jgi:hypothetical protein
VTPFERMDIELSREQPPEVVAALEALLERTTAAEPDPWWQSGLDESLYGETAARPRNTDGADLA